MGLARGGPSPISGGRRGEAWVYWPANSILYCRLYLLRWWKNNLFGQGQDAELSLDMLLSIYPCSANVMIRSDSIALIYFVRWQKHRSVWDYYWMIINFIRKSDHFLYHKDLFRVTNWFSIIFHIANITRSIYPPNQPTLPIAFSQV